jgi:pyruvate dehydrogenase E1 component alpha subunit
MAELLGKKTGVCKGKGGSMHLADFSVGSLGESGIVASAMPVATGAGLSARVRGTDQVSLCFFGDGAANEGAFHESLNLAAAWRLPVIYLCENNGYAITTSFSEAFAITDIADRASGYGMPGVVVDGQDPLAVYDVVRDAVGRARKGQGPSLVEAKTYRFREHSEGSMFRYRTPEEVEGWRLRDPIPMFRHTLGNEFALPESVIAAIEAEVRAEVGAAVEFARSSPYPEPQALYDDLFANPITRT